MLQRMTAFMSCNSSRSNTVNRENHVTEVHCSIGWIVMVGQLSIDACHIHIRHTIIVKHFSSHISTSERNIKRLLRINGELILK